MGALWLWLIISLAALALGVIVTLGAGVLAIIQDGLDAKQDDRKVLTAMVAFCLCILAAISSLLAIVFLIVAGIREATGT